MVNLPKPCPAEARTVPLAQASPASPTPEKPASDSLLEPGPKEDKNSPAKGKSRKFLKRGKSSNTQEHSDLEEPAHTLINTWSV